MSPELSPVLQLTIGKIYSITPYKKLGKRGVVQVAYGEVLNSALIVAEEEKDEKMCERFHNELLGYKRTKDLPSYRVIKGKPITVSVPMIERELLNKSLDDIVTVEGGGFVRIYELREILDTLYVEILKYVSKVLSHYSVEDKLPEPEIPEELKELFKG